MGGSDGAPSGLGAHVGLTVWLSSPSETLRVFRELSVTGRPLSRHALCEPSGGNTNREREGGGGNAPPSRPRWINSARSAGTATMEGVAAGAQTGKAALVSHFAR
ncbi:hypothetical protein GCM10010309_75790 [Streptomyces violaceochromogenes]|nr:hypothetical protein GCM10010309_75790 [Streptomyces violaceochromogenes]